MEAGRPARRGDSSPAPFLRGGSKHPGSRACRPLRGGRLKWGSWSARGSTRQRVRRSPAFHAPGPMTKGVRGLPRGGAPAVLHSLEEWARTGPSRRYPAVARRPRPTSLAMMWRRVVERRRVVKKWWAPSTNAAHSGLVPGAPYLRQVRSGLVAKARASAIPKRAERVKGGGVSQDTSRTAAQIDVALLAVGIPTVEARTGRRHRRGRGFGAQSVVARAS